MDGIHKTLDIFPTHAYDVSMKKRYEAKTNGTTIQLVDVTELPGEGFDNPDDLRIPLLLWFEKYPPRIKKVAIKSLDDLLDRWRNGTLRSGDVVGVENRIPPPEGHTGGYMALYDGGK